MFISTVREKTDRIKVAVITSTDGLAGISAEKFSETLLDMIVDAFPLAFVVIDIDELMPVPSRVIVTELRADVEPSELRAAEERVLEMVRHEAFEACCEASTATDDPEERAAEQAESIARGMRGAS